MTVMITLMTMLCGIAAATVADEASEWPAAKDDLRRPLFITGRRRPIVSNRADAGRRRSRYFTARSSSAQRLYDVLCASRLLQNVTLRTLCSTLAERCLLEMFCANY